MKIKIVSLAYTREDRERGNIVHALQVETRPSTPEEIAAAKSDNDPSGDNAARVQTAQMIQQVLGQAIQQWSQQNEVQIDEEAFNFAVHAYIERVKAKAAPQT